MYGFRTEQNRIYFVLFDLASVFRNHFPILFTESNYKIEDSDFWSEYIFGLASPFEKGTFSTRFDLRSNRAYSIFNEPDYYILVETGVKGARLLESSLYTYIEAKVVTGRLTSTPTPSAMKPRIFKPPITSQKRKILPNLPLVKA